MIYLILGIMPKKLDTVEPENPISVWTAGSPDNVYLKNNVILSYADYGMVGLRAILNITMKLEYWELKVAGTGDLPIICQRLEKYLPIFDRQFQSIMVLNCKYEDFSFILINSYLNGHECHLVINEVLDLLCKK